MHKFFIKSAHRFALLRFLNVQTEIVVNNKRVSVPLRGNMGYANLNLTEPWMTNLLLRLKPILGSAFIDVGVNLGQTLIKIQSIFEDVCYLGFEPNSECIRYVDELIEINKFKKCSIVPVGLANTTEVLKLVFYSDSRVDASASLVADFRPGQPTFGSRYVPVFDGSNLSSLLPVSCNSHSLLKVDVEGGELEVLKGLATWIEQNAPIIIVEILPPYFPENRFRVGRQNEIRLFLKSWGYEFARIKKVPTLHLEWMSEFPMHDDVNDSDYILVPRSATAQIRSMFA